MVTQNAIIAAFASTGLISLAPNLLLVIFPQYASGEGQNSFFLSLGQALAAGGLLGDVFLHVIPHAGGDHDVGLWILLGFGVFLVTDMLIRSLDGESHNHHNHHDDVRETPVQNGNVHEKHIHEEHKTSTILLNVAADALHNFTDGLAIGASFSNYSGNSSDSIFQMLKTRGGLATVSILFHEIPHELGDFAILVKHGFSKTQAIMTQFATAIAAMIGTGLGLVAADMAGDTLIYVTAGGFVYLAAVNILPDILDDGRSMKFRMAQVLFFAIGVAFLYSVSLLEEMDEHAGHGHSHGHHHHESIDKHHDTKRYDTLKIPRSHDHSHDHDHGHHDHGHHDHGEL